MKNYLKWWGKWMGIYLVLAAGGALVTLLRMAIAGN